MRYHEGDLNQIIAVRRTGLEQRARVEKTISARCLEQGQMVLRPSASWHRMLLRKDSEMWRHRMVRPTLDDDDLLDEGTDPAKLFGDDDDLLDDSDDDFLGQQGAKQPQQPATQTSGQQQSRQTSAPSTARAYTPQVAQQPAPRPSPYAPNGGAFSASTPSLQNPALSRSAGTPDTGLGLFDLYNQPIQAPAANPGIQQTQQQQRPELRQAQSFADKSKGGYQSPYDLPMEVVKPRRAPAPRVSGPQGSPQVGGGGMPGPPPRSSGLSRSVRHHPALLRRLRRLLGGAVLRQGRLRLVRVEVARIADLPVAPKPRVRPSGAYTPQVGSRPGTGVGTPGPPMQGQMPPPPPTASAMGPPPSRGPPAPMQAPPPAVQQPPTGDFGGLRQPDRMPLLPDQPFAPQQIFAFAADCAGIYSTNGCESILSCTIRCAASSSCFSLLASTSASCRSSTAAEKTDETSSPLAWSAEKEQQRERPQTPSEAAVQRIMSPPAMNGNASIAALSPERQASARYSPAGTGTIEQPQGYPAAPPPPAASAPPPQRPRTQSPGATMKQQPRLAMTGAERPSSAAEHPSPTTTYSSAIHHPTYQRSHSPTPPPILPRPELHRPTRRPLARPPVPMESRAHLPLVGRRNHHLFFPDTDSLLRGRTRDSDPERLNEILFPEAGEKFPGPLPAKAKGKKKEVLSWGRSKGSGGWSVGGRKWEWGEGNRGGRGSEEDLTPGSAADGSVELGSADPSILLQLRQALLEGQRERAVWLAEEKKLWGHAMLLASTLGPDIWKQIVQAFVRSQVKNAGSDASRSLAALYQIFAGNSEDCVDELVPPSARAGFRMVSRSDGSSDCVGEVIGELWSLVKQSGADDPEAHFVLLGGTHKPSSSPSGSSVEGSPLGNDLDAVQLTEIYEWASSLSTPSTASPYQPYLQPYKLLHAQMLAAHGFKTKAQAYCDHITSAFTSTTRPSPYYHPTFTNAVAELTAFLQQAPQDGKGGSLFSRPAMKNLTNKSSNWFTKFVAGEDEQGAQGEGVGGAAMGGMGGEDATPFGKVSGEFSRTESGTDLYNPMMMGGGMPPSAPAMGTPGPYTPGAPAAQAAGARYAPSPAAFGAGIPASSPMPMQQPPAGRYAPQQASSSTSSPAMAMGTSPQQQENRIRVRRLPDRLLDVMRLSRLRDSARRAWLCLVGLVERRATTAWDTVPLPIRGGVQRRSLGESSPPSVYQPQAPPSQTQEQDEEPEDPFAKPPNGDLAAGTGFGGADDDAEGGGYQPPSSSYGPPASSYEPSGYQPYEPEPEAEEAEAPQPKKKGMMDLSDDEDDREMERRAAALKQQQKSDADRQADEAFRKAAEADAARDNNNNKSSGGSGGGEGKKGWLTGWFSGSGKKDQPQDLNKPIRAKLGEENSFYYDENLKKWVNKKAGPEAAQQSRSRVESAAADHRLRGRPRGSASRNACDGGLTCFGWTNRSGDSGVEWTSESAADGVEKAGGAAKGKKKGAGRYVDVMAK
ncbi:hypothetical protein KC367_g6 [Hortaea werneckii]|nr:hypothetical protein KC367_g6 [Hortaea werneckii]